MEKCIVCYQDKEIRIYPQRVNNYSKSKKYNVCVTYKNTQECKKVDTSKKKF